jgi:indole-3-glycerol phosphate synthase
MHSILEHIIQQKQIEVSELKHDANRKSFKQAIAGHTLSFIGEIKRKSPAKGKLSSILNPIALLQAYLKGDISAVSVLTEKHYFDGSLDDLKQVAAYLNPSSTPVLRKDFILDEVQILESVLAGADAILLIVAVLQDKTRDLLRYANTLKIDVIVEVHDRHELNLAIDIGAEIIGINNRNLTTFEEDMNTCLDLVQHIPGHILKIAESSIKTPEDIKKINQAGFDAVLIGEALVTAENPAITLKHMRDAL